MPLDFNQYLPTPAPTPVAEADIDFKKYLPEKDSIELDRQSMTLGKQRALMLRDQYPHLYKDDPAAFADLYKNQVNAARSQVGLKPHEDQPIPKDDPEFLGGLSVGLAQGVTDVGGLAKSVIPFTSARSSWQQSRDLGEFVPPDAALTSKLGHVLGMVGPAFVPGLGGAKVAATGARLLGAGARATGAAALGGAAVAGGYQQAVPTYFESRDAGMGVGSSLANAAVSGVITGAVTGAFGLRGVLSVFNPKVITGVRAQIVEALKQSGVEAAEEGTDQLLQAAREKMTTNPNMTLGDALQEVGQAAFIGGVAGGAVHLGVHPEAPPRPEIPPQTGSVASGYNDQRLAELNKGVPPPAPTLPPPTIQSTPPAPTDSGLTVGKGVTEVPESVGPTQVPTVPPVTTDIRDSRIANVPTETAQSSPNGELSTPKVVNPPVNPTQPEVSHGEETVHPVQEKVENVGQEKAANVGETSGQNPKPEGELQDNIRDVEPDTVGVKNSFSAEQRQRLGMPDRETPETRAFEEMYDAGKKATEDDPDTVDRIVSDLRENPERILSDTEVGAMVKDAVDRENKMHDLLRERSDAQASGDKNAEKLANDQLIQQRELAQERVLLLERSGTASARALAARRMMSQLDYSLAKMSSVAESAVGSELTAEEHAAVEKHHLEIKSTNEQLQNRLEASKEKDALTAAEKTITELRGEVDRLKKVVPTSNVRAPKQPSKILAALTSAADKARERIKERAKNRPSYSGLDPAELTDYAIVGASHIANGLTKFAVWAKKMVEEFGKHLNPHLQEIFDASKVQVDAHDEGPNIREKLKARAEEGADPQKMRPYFREMALDIIRDGVTAREDVVDALHGQVQEAYPDLSRENVRDILSGYGDVKKLDPETAKRQLREISGELQKVAQLEALNKGQAPLASGLERQPLTAAGRILQKQVNDAKKKAGIVPVKGPNFLKSALDSAKTRIRNLIGELQTEIDTGKRLIRGKTESLSDAELVALKTQLATLREQHAEVFKTGLTDAQKLERAIAATKTNLDRWKERLADARTGKFAGPQKPGPSNAAIDAMRAQSEAARLEYERLRALEPAQKASDQAKSNADYRARLEARRADILDKIARGDFTTQKKPERMLDAETHKLRTSVEAAKRKWQARLTELEHANQSTGRKALRYAAASFGVSKSLRASLDFSALLRQGWGAMFTNPKIWAQHALKTFGDAWQTLGGKEVMDGVNAEMQGSRYYRQAQTGKLPIGVAEEAYPSSLAERIPLIGRAFKASEVVYTAFLRRLRMHIFEKMMDTAKESGVDINDPVQIRAIASVVGSLTGRAGLGRAEQIADVVNNVFFSGRKVVADWNVLTAHSFGLGLKTSFARKQALKNLAKIAAGNAMLLIIAKLFSDESVELDPRSSDFGKIKAGDTRFDVSGGRAPMIVLASRMAAAVLSHFEPFHNLNAVKNSSTGKLSQVNSGKFGAPTVLDLLEDFTLNKLSPIAAVVKNHAVGKRGMSDKPPTALEDAIDLLVPMAATNLIELLQARGATVGSVSAGAIADFFGIGTNTYAPKKKAIH